MGMTREQARFEMDADDFAEYLANSEEGLNLRESWD